jgi:protein tyrosine/serine phosphatase
MKALLVLILTVCGALNVHAAQNNLPLNFVKVSDGIYRGARPSSANLQALAQLGITLDINLQGGDLTNPLFRLFTEAMEPGEQPAVMAAEKMTAQNLGLHYLNQPLDCFDPITAQENVEIEQVLSLLEHASAKNPIYLHCEHGKDRTGMLVALYRVKHDHWAPQQAFEEWERLGHGDVNQVMLHNLDDYFWAKVQTFN